MYSLTIYKLNENPIVLYNAFNSAKFSFLVRSNVKKILIEIGREVIKRIKTETFYSITIDRDNIKGIVHGYINGGIGCIVIDDNNKNHTEHIKGIMIRALNIMSKQSISYESIKIDTYIINKDLDKFFVDASEELKNNKLIKVQNEVDATKAILMDSIDALLERGEKIEDLLEKSNALSEDSRRYLEKTKDLNRCCMII
jgi:synaptobrevin homolog YKT6